MIEVNALGTLYRFSQRRGIKKALPAKEILNNNGNYPSAILRARLLNMYHMGWGR